MIRASDGGADINAAGGVNGEQVTLVGGDEGDDPSVAASRSTTC
jgi:ABC-type branched-subunit amino acid transport system substrate-binding protein